MNYKVRVTKDHLVFCSGHFISYEGDRCERLHGHNYRTAVEIEGPLDVNRYVFDFIALKHRAKEITEETLEAHANTIFTQAENRLHTQKAILAWMLG